MRAMTALFAVLMASAGTADAPPPRSALSLTRLDCGSATIKDFDTFFSDSHELPSGPRKITAKVIIQHEPADIAKLPAFPAAAK